MLIPKEIQNSIPDLYETENIKDPICHVKLFTPDAQWTWYVIELSKKDYDICYGYVKGLENELGYFSLSELEDIKGPLGLEVERDLLFTPVPISSIKTKDV